MERPPVVAIFNTSPDTVEMLRIVLEQAGFVVMGLYTYEARDGKINIENIFKQHEPDVVIYDIAPPYEKNWREFQHMCSMPALARRKFVLTTTNERRVREAIGPNLPEMFEIVGKPYDLGRIVDQVKKLTGQYADR
jgi:DNA-binding NtrC family response regulator